MWECVEKLKIKHSQTDIIESCKLIFFCVWIEMVTHVDNITNVKLPPVDTLTVLCTYISRSTLWFGFGFDFLGVFFWIFFFFCVHVSLRSFYYIFYWTEWAVIGIHFNCCTWISSCTKIYILVIGKVALKKLFCLLYRWDFVYSVCCKACGIHWI